MEPFEINTGGSSSSEPSSQVPESVWDSIRPKSAIGYGFLAAILILGFILGKMTNPEPPPPHKPAATIIDLANAQWLRASIAPFEIPLLPGWENLSTEANLGVSDESKREIVVRQKNPDGSRLLTIQRFNADKKGEKDKALSFLGSWIVSQRQEVQKLKKETSSFFTSELPNSGGVPVEIFQLVNTASSGGGPGILVGTFAFKGTFYEFSYATSHPQDSELLLEILGSIQETKKEAAAPKKTEEPPVKKKAVPAKKTPKP